MYQEDKTFRTRMIEKAEIYNKFKEELKEKERADIKEKITPFIVSIIFLIETEAKKGKQSTVAHVDLDYIKHVADALENDFNLSVGIDDNVGTLNIWWD